VTTRVPDLLDPTADASCFPSQPRLAEVLRRPLEFTQYASGDYQAALAAHGMVCSMSRKGDCWDNAPAESFFSSFKMELVHHVDFLSRASARSSVFDYIEVFFNRRRRHSTLGYKSPAQYEREAVSEALAA
jgi:transposase InsO family protein